MTCHLSLFELNSLIGTNVQVQSLQMFIKQSLHKMYVHSPKVIYFLISGLALTTKSIKEYKEVPLAASRLMTVPERVLQRLSSHTHTLSTNQEIHAYKYTCTPSEESNKYFFSVLLQGRMKLHVISKTGR